MKTLSLAMIVKNEAATIERILYAAQSFCEEMIVVDTGSQDDTIAKANAMGASVYNFHWIDDFAAARNFSFSKCSMDWIIWLDADDLILEEDILRLQKLKYVGLAEDCEAIYTRYVYPPFILWRERLVPRHLFGSKLRWSEPIHECIQGIDPQKVLFRSDIRILHDTPLELLSRKSDRNIRIIRRHFENGAHDERTIYLYAVECLHSFLLEESERVINIFFTSVKNIQYRYEVLSKTYDLYMRFSQPLRAVEALSRAIVEDPRRAEAYYKLGRYVLNHLDRPKTAISLLTLAASISLPDEGTPEMEAYGYGPLEGLCRAHFRLGDLTKAQRFAQKALQHNPPNAAFLQQLAGLVSAIVGRRSLPPQWYEWAASNLARNVPRCTVIRILEENNFSPSQILAAVDSSVVDPLLLKDSGNVNPCGSENSFRELSYNKLKQPDRSTCNTWQILAASILNGHDPYAHFDSTRHRPDQQGWNSHHIYLSLAITDIRPRIVVEVGVWKGGSTIFMAEAMREAGVDGVVIAVDTFLGSWEHYGQPETFASLKFENGYPRLYYTFLTNVVNSRVEKYVLPLPLDSANAAFVLARKQIRPDVIHIDAGHDTEAVLNDLRLWWPLLQPGGVMIADDYDPEGQVWPSVRDGIDAFLKVTPHEAFKTKPYKASWKKPI